MRLGLIAHCIAGVVAVMLVTTATPALAGGKVVTTTPEIAEALDGAQLTGATPWGSRRDSFSLSFSRDASGNLLAEGHNDIVQVRKITISEGQLSMTGRVNTGPYGGMASSANVSFDGAWAVTDSEIVLTRRCNTNCSGKIAGAQMSLKE